MGDFRGHPFRGNQWTAGKAGSKLTESQLDAVDDYVGFHYDSINTHLRLGETASAEVKGAIQGLDEAIAAAEPAAEDTVVYRAAHAPALADAKPGDVYVDKGFVSTSKKQSFASRWKSFADDRVLVVLTVKKGVRGLDVDQTKPHTDEDTGERSAVGEQEVILPRGSTFRVDKVTRGKIFMTVLK